MKKKITIVTILIILALIYGAIFYVIGTVSSIQISKIPISQYMSNILLNKIKPLDIIQNKSELIHIIKNPLLAIKQAFSINKTVFLIIMIIVTILVLYRLAMITIFNEQIFNYLGFNKLIKDKKGTFGTSKFADAKDINKMKKQKTLENEKGIILGSIKKPYTLESLKKYNTKYRITIGPKVKMLNGHAIVVSGSGAGKTFNFVLTNAINAIRDGVNVLFTDPKGELFKTLSKYYEQNGYTVRVLNLINTEKSDRFNPLSIVENELDVVTFIDVLFENARSLESTGVNDFWDTGAKDLLKAVILYIKATYSEEKQNMGEVYDLIIESANIEQMDLLFDDIDDDTAMKRAYKLFRNSEDKAREGIILGLGLKLQIFQHKDIRKLTQSNDINMYDLKTKKSAFFIIMPDTHNSYNFIPSIFMNFLFIKLPYLHDNTSDEKIKNTKLRIFADEIANVGKIANLKNVITTLRSRKIDFFPIYQNIAQIKEVFGKGWETITGNCDTFITLGVNDEETSEYISEKLGKQTIKTISKNKTDGLTKIASVKRWSISEQQRDLMQPSEVKRLNKFKCIAFIRGENPLLLYKYPFSALDEYKEIKKLEININDYVPVYQRQKEPEETKQENKQFVLSKQPAEPTEVIEKEDQNQEQQKNHTEQEQEKETHQEQQEKTNEEIILDIMEDDDEDII
ncbi:type IV secretory system conjugative DNA transfer family protein [Sedimentibacter sp. zth1]|uniref:VirD4-like conjugal transfer protein, CD1115 family n=1 Tax=Sedimentibacter sp. zth1 TaxID=2816908 RepID=UPI001A9322E7|nr:type IV secretory system conjugative DNA transfer family protein [Sedimentibacter sp. zth1]QSX05430.1 type IV secretory system conjugative DNA transfer family protein [Sedimentibacter sp. zth1]